MVELVGEFLVSLTIFVRLGVSSYTVAMLVRLSVKEKLGFGHTNEEFDPWINDDEFDESDEPDVFVLFLELLLLLRAVIEALDSSGNTNSLVLCIKYWENSSFALFE